MKFEITKGNNMKNWNAYHFVGNTLRDGSPVPENGATLHHEGKLELCHSGFHASKYAWQALEYAPAATLCRVKCGGKVIYSDDKLVCSERTIVSRINADALLRKFARDCALDVIHLWDAPDIVIEYLESGDEKLRDAAREASWAAGDTAWGASWAARAAARAAAWGASRAAMAAARAAAWGASWAAMAAARDAARDASWAAAWGASRAAVIKKQRTRLTKAVNAAFERT